MSTNYTNVRVALEKALDKKALKPGDYNLAIASLDAMREALDRKHGKLGELVASAPVTLMEKDTMPSFYTELGSITDEKDEDAARLGMSVSGTVFYIFTNVEYPGNKNGLKKRYIVKTKDILGSAWNAICNQKGGI